MAFLESSKDLFFVLRNTLNIKTGMNMEITKNDLLEMNITDIHEKCESRTKFRSCRILYDFCELWNLQALLRVGCKKHIEETLKSLIVVTIEKKPRLDLKRDMGSPK